MAQYHTPICLWKDRLLEALVEDQWAWDWSSMGLPAGKRVHARVIAREDGVWAAGGIGTAAEDAAREHGFAIRATELAREGRRFRMGQAVLRFEGPSRALLALERPVLNLAAYACGIATATARFVAAVEDAARARKIDPAPRVTATRKILPHYRDIAVRAVMAGGGHSHRISLGGGVLIKENHIACAGGVAQAVKSAREAAPHVLRIEVEVRNPRELDQALRAGVDAVLLDNFRPSTAREAARKAALSGRPVQVEVSGGLTAENVVNYVLPGVHVLSVGSLTHTVRAADFSLLVT